MYYKKKDGFSLFSLPDLKNYKRFKNILLEFRGFYGLQKYNIKEIDKYLWQLGKEYFPKNF